METIKLIIEHDFIFFCLLIACVVSYAIGFFKIKQILKG